MRLNKVDRRRLSKANGREALSGRQEGGRVREESEARGRSRDTPPPFFLLHL